MIEVIREEDWNNSQDRRELPKNIKQIGKPDVGDRIYIENSAYQKMHLYGQQEEKKVYVLLGRFDDFAGQTCIFIEDVIKMDEVQFNGRLPLWNDDSWGYLYRKIRPEHENMIIVGWGVDICGQLPGMTAQLERVHQTYFGGMHQILLLMDTLEREEAFFSNRSGYLKRREGFYIYYDKVITDRMESVIETLQGENHKIEKESFKEEQPSGRREYYREYMNGRNKEYHPRRIRYKRAYSSTWLLLAVICALGYSAFWNYQKMESMEQTLNQMEFQSVIQPQTEQENVVRVEEVMGNVTAAENGQETQSTEMPEAEVQTSGIQPEAQMPLEQTPETQVQSNPQMPEESLEQTMSEAETYLAQGYYVVQQGDSLANICRKIYHTTALLEKLCEVNGIDNPDAIYVGQHLTLPD